MVSRAGEIVLVKAGSSQPGPIPAILGIAGRKPLAQSRDQFPVPLGMASKYLHPSLVVCKLQSREQWL